MTDVNHGATEDTETHRDHSLEGNVANEHQSNEDLRASSVFSVPLWLTSVIK